MPSLPFISLGLVAEMFLFCVSPYADTLSPEERQLITPYLAWAAPERIESDPPHSPATCGTPAMHRLHHARSTLSPTAKSLLQDLDRPQRQFSHLSPAARFRLHYDLDGLHAVAATDLDANGVPDYIQLAAALIDSVWDLEITSLGYTAPPGDEGRDGPEWDIYFSQLGSGIANYGAVYPESGATSAQGVASYMVVDNDFSDPSFVQTRGLDGLRVTLAHEFFHMVQVGSYDGPDDTWWQEATATWIEDVAYPQINDYYQYLPRSSSLILPGVTLDSPSLLYGNSLFVFFLAQSHGDQTVRHTWEEIARRRRAQLADFDAVVPGGLVSAVQEYAVWNYFTGTNSLSGRFYAEAAQYPSVTAPPLEASVQTVSNQEGQVDYLASAYVALRPAGRPGGIRFEIDTPEGRWVKRLLLIAGDSVATRPVSDQIEVPDWDAYDEVVLVLTVSETSRRGYKYRVDVEYDLLLGETAGPVALKLGPAYPQPFRPQAGSSLTIPYALKKDSPVTRLTVYTPDGRQVRSFDLGAQPGQSRGKLQWDGRNTAGKRVAAGIYYCVIEVAGQQRTLPLAILAP